MHGLPDKDDQTKYLLKSAFGNYYACKVWFKQILHVNNAIKN